MIGREAILTEWMQAGDALRGARGLIELNEPNGSLSRSYYANLHAARAALMTQGITTKSHRGLKGTFGKYLVVPGHFEKGMGKDTGTASETRLEADYGSSGRFPLEDASDQADQASRFIERTRQFLKTQGFAEHELDSRPDGGDNTPGTPRSGTTDSGKDISPNEGLTPTGAIPHPTREEGIDPKDGKKPAESKSEANAGEIPESKTPNVPKIVIRGAGRPAGGGSAPQTTANRTQTRS